jgi:hypothetical protein
VRYVFVRRRGTAIAIALPANKDFESNRDVECISQER